MLEKTIESPLDSKEIQPIHPKGNQSRIFIDRINVETETPILSLSDSLVAQMVKHLPAIRETRVRFLGREDPLEKVMAIHSSTLAWRIPWTKEPGGLQSMGSQRAGHD